MTHGLDIHAFLSYNLSYIHKTIGVHMKTITVRLDDDLANEVDRLQQAGAFRNKSDVIREGLRALVARELQRRLKENLTRYLAEQDALAKAAHAVEDRMSLTEEALKRS